MFYDNITDVRQQFITCWTNYRNQQPLSALERQIIAVILEHPEFHATLESPDALTRQYFPELGDSNPFLHMGLHLSVREQINTNRPPGIAQVHQNLSRDQPPLEAEHALMECLVECLWQAQRQNTPPNEHAYLAACQKLLVN